MKIINLLTKLLFDFFLYYNRTFFILSFESCNMLSFYRLYVFFKFVINL